MIGDLINLNLFAFLLVFTRVGTAVMLMPGFGSQQVPENIRLTFALALSFILTPALKDVLPGEPAEVSVLFMLLTSEVLIGVFMGMVPRIFISALQTAGTVLSMVAGMSNMFIQDPIAEQQSSLFTTYLGLMALTIVFVTNTHHLMLAALVDSYSLFPPIGGAPIADMSDSLARMISASFAMGVQLSTPLIISGLAYYLGLGILGRLMPQLPVFFFGMPIQIALQMYLLMVALTSMMMVFMNYFQDGLMGMAPSFGG
ncbi:MAG TPA: flagellar biosynthetic protein FliR [Magnetovibrio sp.]